MIMGIHEKNFLDIFFRVELNLQKVLCFCP
jgi:hypothetical protein